MDCHRRASRHPWSRTTQPLPLDNGRFVVTDYLIPALAAFIAGVMNALVGGGSFFTFPALVFTGVPPVLANASSTVALLPGVFASALAYREDYRPIAGIALEAILLVSIAGGASGASLLLYLPAEAFEAIVPWLLLLATVLFAFGPWLAPVLAGAVRMGPAALLTAQFFIALYGGYFGGAVGLIMLAVWSLSGVTDIKMMNANRTLLGGSMNAAAVVLFILAGSVVWPQTILMLVASVLGGYSGARAARRMNPRLLRAVITLIAIGVTTAFFAI